MDDAAGVKIAAPAARVTNGGHPLPLLNLAVTEPFYLLHLFVFFSYFVVRSSAVQDLHSDLSLQLLRRLSLFWPSNHHMMMQIFEQKYFFGTVDLGHFPNAAENFGISLSGPQPTYKMLWKLLASRNPKWIQKLSCQLLPRALSASVLSLIKDLLNTYQVENSAASVLQQIRASRLRLMKKT